MRAMNKIIKTVDGKDVTLTNDYKALAAAPKAATGLAATFLNLIPIDILLPMAISVAIRVATSGTGTRSAKIKKVLIVSAQGIANEFPDEVCPE